MRGRGNHPLGTSHFDIQIHKRAQFSEIFAPEDVELDSQDVYGPEAVKMNSQEINGSVYGKAAREKLALKKYRVC